MNIKPIVIFLLIALVSLGGYEVYTSTTIFKEQPKENQIKENTNVKDTTVDSKNWLIYQNTSYKYSIKYPQDFTTQNNAAGVGTSIAKDDSRSIYIYSKNSKETYLERYVEMEVFHVDTSSGSATQIELNGIRMKKELAREGATFSIYIVPLNTGDFLQIYVTDDTLRRVVANAILNTLKLD